MAEKNNNKNYRGGGFRQKGYPGNGKNNKNQQEKKPIEAKELPHEYVDEAEKAIRKNGEKITTSKLRNLLSQFVDVYNAENLLTGDKLQPASVNALTMARIRMLYEAGRDKKSERIY